MNQSTSVRTCFLKSTGEFSCNAYRPVQAGAWSLAATNVRDNTTFYLQFTSSGRTGLAAY